MCPPQSPLSGEKAHADLKPRRVFCLFVFVLTKWRGGGGGKEKKKRRKKGKKKFPGISQPQQMAVKPWISYQSLILQTSEGDTQALARLAVAWTM